MYILIDDTRTFGDVIIRNFDSAITLLEHIDFDYTLGIDHDLGGKKTGYDLLKWMFKKDIYPKKIQLVTSNPVGRKNMAHLLFFAGYNSFTNVNFVREI